MFTDRSDSIEPQTQIQTPTAKHSMELGNSYGTIGGRIVDTEGDRNSTGRTTQSTKLYPLDSQRLNHQPKNIFGLDLGFQAYM